MNETCALAINLANNAGYVVLPCRGDDKRPTLTGWQERASTDPAAIAALWDERPGELVGVVTGQASGVSVLDIDVKHDDAMAWWEANQHRLPRTRTFQTRSGGLHLWFRHADGVRNSQGRVCPGIDTRGDGGFIIHWFSAGYPCLDHSPPAAWPGWLLHAVTYRPPPSPPPDPAHVDPGKAIDRIVQRVAATAEGERNAVLFWAACRLSERGIGLREAEALLLPAARAAGHASADEQIAARRTIASAYRGGRRAA